MYTTKSKYYFTVVTAKAVFRVHAANEAIIRTAFGNQEILGIHRDD